MLLDPIDELGNARVDSRLVRLSAANTEADDAMQPPSVIDVTDKRTTGVALAGVLAALGVTSTQQVVGDVAA